MSSHRPLAALLLLLAHGCVAIPGEEPGRTDKGEEGPLSATQPLVIDTDGLHELSFDLPSDGSQALLLTCGQGFESCDLDMGLHFDTLVPEQPDWQEGSWLEPVGVRVESTHRDPSGETVRSRSSVPLANLATSLEALQTFRFDEHAEVELQIDDPWALLTTGRFSGVRLELRIDLCAGLPCRHGE